MTTPDADDVFRRLAQHVYETQEAGFLRHLHYCLLTRHAWWGDRAWVRDRCRDAIRMVRFKRAVMRATDEERERYGLVGLTPDVSEGWTTSNFQKLMDLHLKIATSQAGER